MSIMPASIVAFPLPLLCPFPTASTPPPSHPSHHAPLALLPASTATVQPLSPVHAPSPHQATSAPCHPTELNINRARPCARPCHMHVEQCLEVPLEGVRSHPSPTAAPLPFRWLVASEAPEILNRHRCRGVSRPPASNCRSRLRASVDDQIQLQKQGVSASASQAVPGDA